MKPQVCYEDVAVGQELEPLRMTPTRRQAVKWAGASGDYYEIHYDKDFARAAGQPDVIVHGALKAAIAAQLLTTWMGLAGFLRKISCQFRGIDFFDVELTCRGRVTDRFLDGDAHCVAVEVWIENAAGERTTVGNGVVVLPSRHADEPAR